METYAPNVIERFLPDLRDYRESCIAERMEQEWETLVRGENETYASITYAETKLDEMIVYAEYIAEQLDKNINYSSYIAEQLEEVLKFDDYYNRNEHWNNRKKNNR